MKQAQTYPDSYLLKCFKQGWEDAANGEIIYEGTVSCTQTSAYNLGVFHFKSSDDIDRIDLLSDAEILALINSQMKKQFSHSINLRNEPKIKAIRNKFGLIGYAIYLMFIERLKSNENEEIEYSFVQVEIMAGDFGLDVDKLKAILNSYFKELNIIEIMYNRVYLSGRAEIDKPKQSEFIAEQLQHWIIDYINSDCPNVAAMKKPLTYEQAEKLSSCNEPFLKDLFKKMDNHKELNKKYVSAYDTFINWSKREIEVLNQNKVPKSRAESIVS